MSFKKVYIKRDERDKQIKKLKRDNKIYAYFIIINSLCISFILIYFLAIPGGGGSIPYIEDSSKFMEISRANILSEINIDYTDLNEKEIVFFNNILKQINPLFLYAQQEIIVTNNMTKYGKGDKSYMMSGQNINAGEKIIILFTENENRLKETISHEFLHTYFRLFDGDEEPDHPTHKIVYLLGSRQVAFNG